MIPLFNKYSYNILKGPGAITPDYDRDYISHILFRADEKIFARVMKDVSTSTYICKHSMTVAVVLVIIFFSLLKLGPPYEYVAYGVLLLQLITAFFPLLLRPRTFVTNSNIIQLFTYLNNKILNEAIQYVSENNHVASVEIKPLYEEHSLLLTKTKESLTKEEAYTSLCVVAKIAHILYQSGCMEAFYKDISTELDNYFTSPYLIDQFKQHCLKHSSTL